MNALIEQIRGRKQRRERIAMLTAYDYPMARLLDESGIDLVLVGDSLGMVVLGYPDTTRVTLADILHHLRAVRRGVKRAAIIADLPIGTCETVEDAVTNSKLLVEAGASAVKLEGALVPQIRAIVQEGIPVMGHLGMLPQQVLLEGGYKVKGRTSEDADRLLREAKLVEEAGAFSVVLELVEAEAAQRISDGISIPTIGIGSGLGCDGQVLVTHDLIGIFPWFKPRFVRQKAQVAGEIQRAVAEFIRETKGE
jgi:3-methyl-2-oxobutanoate hydroxymethyltransferase